MDMKEIKELIKLIDSSSITEFKLDREEYKLSIKKEQTIVKVLDREQESLPVKNIDERKVEASAAAEAKSEEENVHYIKSPILGTFYSSPSPDAAPFVKAGDRIKKGDVLCIVEAMKLMNEVNSDIDGEIAEVLVKDKSIVEYGQPLFKVRQV